eukprot:gene7284-400_t
MIVLDMTEGSQVFSGLSQGYAGDEALAVVVGMRPLASSNGQPRGLAMGNQDESLSSGESMEELLKHVQAGTQGETPPSEDLMAELLSFVQEEMQSESSSSGDPMKELMKVLRAGNQEESMSNEELMGGFLKAYTRMKQAKTMKKEPMEELLKRAKALPMMCTPNTPGFTPEIWAVSYTA